MMEGIVEQLEHAANNKAMRLVADAEMRVIKLKRENKKLTDIIRFAASDIDKVATSIRNGARFPVPVGDYLKIVSLSLKKGVKESQYKFPLEL